MRATVPVIRVHGLTSHALTIVQRLCATDFRVIVGDDKLLDRQDRALAVVRQLEAGNEAAWQGGSTRQVLVLVLVQQGQFSGMAMPVSAHATVVMNLTVARDRLALLALFASFLAESPNRRIAESLTLRSLRSPLLWQVTQIQRRIDLCLSEQRLSARLGVTSTTLRRWFEHDGPMAPCRFMQWIRLLEVADRVEHTQLSASRVVELLGLPDPDSVRRTLKKLAGLPLHELREVGGREQLASCFATAVSAK